MKLIHEGWSVLLASIVNGGPVRLTLVALLLGVTVILTLVGCSRRHGSCSLWLLYLAGITFFFGLISGATNGMHC